MLSWLEGKKCDVYSQFGEDGYIKAIFDKIGTTNKWCLEVGAYDGIYFSNTRRLCEQGWNAVLIESQKGRYEQLCKNAPEAHCVNAEIEPIGLNSLDVILAETPAPLLFDLISIDIDGKDYQVWEGLKKYAGRVVVVEHAYMDTGLSLGQATPQEMEKLAGQKGYIVVAKTECNSICVQKILVEG